VVKHFENDEYRIRLALDGVQVSALSRSDIDLLNEISHKNAGLGTWDLAESTHTEEYTKNYREGTSTPISLEDVIDAVAREAGQTVDSQGRRKKKHFSINFSREPMLAGDTFIPAKFDCQPLDRHFQIRRSIQNRLDSLCCCLKDADAHWMTKG